MYKIKENEIKTLAKNIQKEATIYGPKKQENQFVFEEIYNVEELYLDYNTSILPPSKIFFPNNEVLLKGDIVNQKASSVLEEENKVLFAVHPCDISGINVMDNFLTKYPEDQHYIARRKSTTIIGLQCIKPCTDKTLCYDKQTLFADNFYDIMLWKGSSYYFVETLSDLGASIIKANKDLFETIDVIEFEDFMEDFKHKQTKNFKRTLMGKPENLTKSLRNMYNSDLWKELGEKCFSCSACTIVCPTCYCFDVHDKPDIDLQTVVRYRTWDSCQNCSFSLIGTGENFREGSHERNRHRIFKKEVYAVENFGISGCVGCGRCNTTCVVDISLIEVYNHALANEII